MTYEDFMALDEDQRRAAYIASEMLQDVEAERDSYRHENEQLQAANASQAEELKKTKELNYTLARKTSIAPEKTAEEYMHDAFGRIK